MPLRDDVELRFLATNLDELTRKLEQLHGAVTGTATGVPTMSAASAGERAAQMAGARVPMSAGAAAVGAYPSFPYGIHPSQLPLANVFGLGGGIGPIPQQRTGQPGIGAPNFIAPFASGGPATQTATQPAVPLWSQGTGAVGTINITATNVNITAQNVTVAGGNITFASAAAAPGAGALGAGAQAGLPGQGGAPASGAPPMLPQDARRRASFLQQLFYGLGGLYFAQQLVGQGIDLYKPPAGDRDAVASAGSHNRPLHHS